MITEVTIAVLSIALTAYYLHKAKPSKECPGSYLLYIAFMFVVAFIDQILTMTALTTLVPVVEETYKILGARLTPGKNKYIISGAVFGITELVTYLVAVPTYQMLVTRSMVLYIHPTTMLLYSYLREKVNGITGFFAAVVYHGTWNILMIKYPWHMTEISGIYIAATTIMAVLLLKRADKNGTVVVPE